MASIKIEFCLYVPERFLGLLYWAQRQNYSPISEFCSFIQALVEEIIISMLRLVLHNLLVVILAVAIYGTILIIMELIR